MSYLPIGSKPNPTVVGTALTWTALTNTSIEYDISATNATTITGGTNVDNGQAIDTTPAFLIPVDLNEIRMGHNIAGTPDVMVLCVQRLTGGTESFYGNIVFQEYR